MQNVNKFMDKYTKPKSSMEDLEAHKSPVDMEEHMKKYAITPNLAHHRNSSEFSGQYTFDQSTCEKNLENSESADQLMNNIVTLMNGEAEKNIVEEEENCKKTT